MQKAQCRWAFLTGPSGIYWDGYAYAFVTLLTG